MVSVTLKRKVTNSDSWFVIIGYSSLIIQSLAELKGTAVTGSDTVPTVTASSPTIVAEKKSVSLGSAV